MVITISLAILCIEAFQPRLLIKNSVINQGIKMSITPPDLLELSSTLKVASLNVIPSSFLSTDVFLSLFKDYKPIVFWIVNVLIFNLAKGGQSYPIGPLALPESATEYPSLFNKVCIEISMNQ